MRIGTGAGALLRVEDVQRTHPVVVHDQTLRGGLALVRLAIGRGRDASADHAGEDDDRHQVGQGAVELGRDAFEEVARGVVRRGKT